MFKFKPLIAALLVAATMPGAASAAIVQVFGDQASFAAAVPRVTVLPLDLAGVPPVLVTDFVVGDLRISALDGELAGDGGSMISTGYDLDVMILDFARPVFGVGLFGLVVDGGFAAIDGELLVDVVGSGTASLTTSGGAKYFAFLSDVAFTQLRLSVTSFDGDASSVAFAALQTSVDQAGPIPEPAVWLTMIAGFAMLGARQRMRRVAS